MNIKANDNRIKKRAFGGRIRSSGLPICVGKGEEEKKRRREEEEENVKLCLWFPSNKLWRQNIEQELLCDNQH